MRSLAFRFYDSQFQWKPSPSLNTSLLEHSLLKFKLQAETLKKIIKIIMSPASHTYTHSGLMASLPGLINSWPLSSLSLVHSCSVWPEVRSTSLTVWLKLSTTHRWQSLLDSWMSVTNGSFLREQNIIIIFN